MSRFAAEAESEQRTSEEGWSFRTQTVLVEEYVSSVTEPEPPEGHPPKGGVRARPPPRNGSLVALPLRKRGVAEDFDNVAT